MRYLSRGWRHIADYPLLLGLPLALTMVTSLLGIGVAGAAMGWAMAGQVGRGGGFLLIAVLGTAVVAPAVSSGYNAMVGSAVRHEVPSLATLTGNLGKYFGRILGGAVLLGLAIAVLGVLFGRGLNAAGGLSLVSLITMLLSYLTHLWFAAMVLEDAGIFDAARLAVGQFARRFYDFGPLLAISLAAALLLPAILRVGDTQQVIGARSLLSALLTNAVAIVLRVATFSGYADGQAAGMTADWSGS